ncbi:MAG: heterodisulfide reductase-related iron-sulfur binding cluster, partial [Candidatus Korarchaeota archaeon]|nr:heterodisulfide reductase-related iron-sulfur binding cluster [Candidatus Korarchaeota archaeon]
MKYAYYPGCTMKSSYSHVEKSILRLAEYLGVELEEVEDWNCCGAAEIVNVNEEASLLLPARVLALAAKISDRVLVPCTECLYNLRRTVYFFDKHPEAREKIAGVLAKRGLELKPLEIRHPIDMVLRDIGVDRIK